jgi:hypothetical protein
MCVLCLPFSPSYNIIKKDRVLWKEEGKGSIKGYLMMIGVWKERVWGEC